MTTAHDTRHHVTLTQDQMNEILDQDNWLEVIVTAWRAIEPAWDDMGTVKPTDYVIPVAQWHAICDHLMAKGEPMDQTNHMIDWVNKGPSAESA